AAAIASHADATANPSASERVREARPPFSNGGTCAATWVRWRDASSRVNAPITVTPRRVPSQSLGTPQPKGVTAPKPVTTMSLGRLARRSAPGMRVGGGGEASLDVGREGGDRSEGLAADLVALDPQREFFFESDDELQRVDRVEPETLTEQRHVVPDALGSQAFEVKLVDQKALDPLSGRGIVRHNVGSCYGLRRRQSLA